MTAENPGRRVNRSDRPCDTSNGRRHHGGGHGGRLLAGHVRLLGHCSAAGTTRARSTRSGAPGFTLTRGHGHLVGGVIAVEMAQAVHLRTLLTIRRWLDRRH